MASNPGNDKFHFMEQAVTAMLSVRTSAEGGVGYESMVIITELAEHMHTNKFVPVLRDGAWGCFLPVYLKSRMGVNLRGNPYSENEYRRLRSDPSRH